MAALPEFDFGPEGQGDAKSAKPLDNPDVRWMMQSYLDYFDHYWMGRGEQWKDEEAQGLRRPVYSQMQVPRTRSGPRDRSGQPEGAPDVNPKMRSRKRYGGEQNKEKYQKFLEDVNAGQFGIVNFTQPLGLELKRVLGKGGFGIACLFSLTLPDGTKQKMVIKSAIREGALDREMVNMRDTTGAMHVVQRRYMRRLPTAQAGGQEGPGPAAAGLKRENDGDPEGGAPPSLSKIAKTDGGDVAKAAKRLDRQRNMYAMEYMMYGDIFRVLQRYGREGRRFASEDMWMIFHCLFRGCVGLAYPGSWLRGNPKTEDVPLLYEVVPRNFNDPNGNPVSHSQGLVHFDLDPLNTMLGGFDAAHPRTPMAKVGDLGIANTFTIVERMNFGYMMRKRTEQNTKEWDYLDKAPFIGGMEPTAGNYDFWSNLYQAAHVIWSMITLAAPDVPPQCSREVFRVTNDLNQEVWTYGGLLLKPTKDTQIQDDRLLRVVAKCMAHRPSERISMSQLEHIFTQMCDQSQWANGEANMDQKSYLRDVLASAPPPAGTVQQPSQAIDPQVGDPNVQ